MVSALMPPAPWGAVIPGAIASSLCAFVVKFSFVSAAQSSDRWQAALQTTQYSPQTHRDSECFHDFLPVGETFDRRMVSAGR